MKQTIGKSLEETMQSAKNEEQISLENMVKLNDLMVLLTGVPLGVGLAPEYKFRKEYIEILQMCNQPDSPEGREKAKEMINKFRVLNLL